MLSKELKIYTKELSNEALKILNIKSTLILSGKSFQLVKKQLESNLNVSNNIIWEQNFNDIEVITFIDAYSKEYNKLLCKLPPYQHFSINLYNKVKDTKLIHGAMQLMCMNATGSLNTFDIFIRRLIYYSLIYYNKYKNHSSVIRFGTLVNIVIHSFLYDICKTCNIESNRENVSSIINFEMSRNLMERYMITCIKKDSLENGCPKICTKGNCSSNIKKSISKTGRTSNNKIEFTDEEIQFIKSDLSVRKCKEEYEKKFDKKISIGTISKIKNA